ncbi:hypothetical protein BAJUN_01600 [Bajunvirus bajun]|uniref:Uncharacterized protein n=1 Tax=Brevundimonas phage vB_BgoS-Bajun TaxID=2948594 RepID=A0A9E7N657_9CAUD|nr:hypothetical protein BAJUN_01600 [Brevundimonas phage vB_BgoS-Bajun]
MKKRQSLRPRAGFVHGEEGLFVAPDCVIETPRPNRIEGIGILDHRGHRLFRVTIPIKQQMGFYTGGNAWTGVGDEVSTILPEDMIDVSTDGSGIDGYDVDIDDEEEDGEYE